MTPWLILAAVIAILALALWLGRRLERAREAAEREDDAAERAAAEREDREDARWAALLQAIYARRPAGMTDADARHALALDTLRRRALGGRQDSEAA